MIFAPESAAAAIAAMKSVAEPLTDLDETTLQAAWTYLFRQESPLNVGNLPSFDPASVANADRETVAHAVAVMPFVDGKLDEAKAARAVQIADSLGIHADFVAELHKIAERHLTGVLACMIRENVVSIHNGPFPSDDAMAFFLPYRDLPDPALVAKHEALRDLAPGTLGREYYAFYKRNQFLFPGDPNALTVEFAHPHDTTHLLSGYNTDPHGELLVSTFTAGMHPLNPMEGHILPVIFSWHLGIKLNDVAKSATGAFDPVQFWRAWERGLEVKTDVFAPGWDFWAACERPLHELRTDYGVPVD